MSNILQLKIILKRVKPTLWRRFLVDDNLTFRDLHFVIQHVMGWTNSHLYQFIYNRNSFLGNPKLLEDESTVNDNEVTLSHLFDKEGTEIDYEYDFGDGWMHSIVLEKLLPKEKDIFYPTCIKGKNCCPPEDCGGLGGFMHLLELLKKKRSKEKTEMLEWLGGHYNPNEFDLAFVNENLKDYRSIDFDGF